MARFLRVVPCLLVLTLGACSTAQNLAANFVPLGKADVTPADIKSGTYHLDPEHGSVTFSFNHMNFSTTRVRFNSVDASLVYDNQNAEAAMLTATIDMASVDSNDAEFDDALKGKDFFEVEKYPEAVFTAHDVKFTSDNTAEVPGMLTLHGQTVPVTLSVTLTGAGKNWINGKYTLGFYGRTTVNRSDFGLKNLLALTGDAVTIEINVELNLEE